MDGLTDEIVDEVSLGLGALGSRASASTAGTELNYLVAGAELNVSSPLVAGLTGVLDAAVDDVSDTLNSTLGPDGTVQGLLDDLSFDPIGLDIGVGELGLVDVELDLGSPQLNASADLDDVTDGLLEDPVVSDNGLVTLDPSTGLITVDLAMLHGGDLNDLDPGTQLLTSGEITQITDTVADLLGQTTGLVTDAVLNALETTELSIVLEPDVSVDVANLAGVSSDLALTVTGTLAEFTGQAADEPEVTGSGGVTINLLGGLLSLPIPLGAIVGGVTGPILEDVVPAVGGALAPVPRARTSSPTPSGGPLRVS